MKRLDYNFNEYRDAFNSVARQIISESIDEDYDADQVSQQIDEAQVTYNKIQKILNCPEMIKSHAYLYALDMENVDESDRKKIDKLYDLGVARGVITDEPEDNGSDEDDIDPNLDNDDENVCGGPQDALTGQEMTPGETTPAKTSSAFTVLYSAMKDGQVKTGEFFSSAVDQDAARSDCLASLSPLGYSNIRVLGIEQANDAVDFQNSDLDTLDEDSKTDAEDEAQETGDTSAQNQKEENKTETSDGTEGQEGGSENKDENPGQNSETTDNQDTGADGKENGDSGETEEKPEETADDSGETSSEGEPEQKKLTPTEKGVLKDEFIGMFKAELQATKLEKSPNDMNIKEKADFWNKILEKWKKQDPEEFMSPKEIEKLNNTVIKNN
jgi:hypothetical protein